MTNRDLASWAPKACTLPTAQRPPRVAESDELFTTAVLGASRLTPTTLRLDLEPTADVAAKTADLMVRENACCSFFTFTLTTSADGLSLAITVPEGHVDVLDGLTAGVDA